MVCVLRVLERLQGTVCGVIGNFAGGGSRGGSRGGGGASQTLFFGVLGSCFGGVFRALYIENGEI